MGVRELMKLQQTSVPLKVRLFYVNEYYDMARQAYHKQWRDFGKRMDKFQSRFQAQFAKQGEPFVQERSIREQVRKELAHEEPMFQSVIQNTDLVQMIIDALRFRVKWAEIEKGHYFESPALKAIAQLWYTRVGLRYVNPHIAEQEAKKQKIAIQRAN